jgi:sugar phosphate isomerase/epimerase
MTTRTGTFRIGLCAGTSDWQRDLPGLARWAAQAGFELLDLPAVTIADVRAVQATGVEVGCMDALDWPGLLSADSGRRKAAIALNARHFHDMAAHQIHTFRVIATPEHPERHPRENFDLAVGSLAELAEIALSLGCIVVLEGFPGTPPHYANIGCNPEQCRAMLKAVPGNGLGLCYNPAHLIRMGIDHARFLDEFATRIGHVRSQDTEVQTDNLYEVGLYQRSLTDPPWEFGDMAWRYTIPGHGEARWTYILRMLQLAGYKGSICMELADAAFAGSAEDERAGIRASLEYLHSA